MSPDDPEDEAAAAAAAAAARVLVHVPGGGAELHPAVTDGGIRGSLSQLHP